LLVAFMNPSAVSDYGAYQHWLQRAMRQASSNVRLVLADSVDAPALAELARAESKLVSTPCELDMSEATEELSLAAGLDTPGAQFRHLFVQLGNAAKAGDLVTAVSLAQLATQLAEGVQWPHLAAVAQTLLAGMYAGLGQQLEAIRCYAEVDRLGIATIARGESGQAAPEGAAELQGEVARAYGMRLRRDARFGQGACLISQGSWDHAARVYLDAAPLSHELGDARGELDCLRLASLCFEQQGKKQEAWQCGMRGLEVAGSMDDETCKTSTLPYLGESLLRLASTPEYAIYRDPLETQLGQLLGKDWRSQLQKGAA
jgi:hypothetical protein